MDMFCNIIFIEHLVPKVLSLPGYSLTSLFFHPNIFCLLYCVEHYKQNTDLIKLPVSCNEMDDVFIDIVSLRSYKLLQRESDSGFYFEYLETTFI